MRWCPVATIPLPDGARRAVEAHETLWKPIDHERLPTTTAPKPININMHVAGSGTGTAMMLPDDGGPPGDALATPKESNREAANPPVFT